MTFVVDLWIGGGASEMQPQILRFAQDDIRGVREADLAAILRFS
jgi:hypothetical protein